MFRFRLQQVLDLRQKREHHLATQLVRAMGDERDAQGTLDDLRAIREAGIDLPTPGASRSVGELSNLAFLLGALDGQIANATDAVDAAGHTVSEVKEALTGALQDRRILDRLRDRHQASHRLSEEQTDRRTMDDIALSRHTLGEAR